MFLLWAMVSPYSEEGRQDSGTNCYPFTPQTRKTSLGGYPRAADLLSNRSIQGASVSDADGTGCAMNKVHVVATSVRWDTGT